MDMSVPLTSASPEWMPDQSAEDCMLCWARFDWMRRRHHCRKCGRVICSDCANRLNYSGKKVLVCFPCQMKAATERSPGDWVVSCLPDQPQQQQQTTSQQPTSSAPVTTTTVSQHNTNSEEWDQIIPARARVSVSLFLAEEKADQEAPLLKEGWLSQRLEGSNQWAPRYFNLLPHALICLRNQQDPRPMGKILIRSGVSLSFEEDEGSETDFSVVMSKLTVDTRWRLRASDSEERDAWIQALGSQFYYATRPAANLDRKSSLKIANASSTGTETKDDNQAQASPDTTSNEDQDTISTLPVFNKVDRLARLGRPRGAKKCRQRSVLLSHEIAYLRGTKMMLKLGQKVNPRASMEGYLEEYQHGEPFKKYYVHCLTDKLSFFRSKEYQAPVFDIALGSAVVYPELTSVACNGSDRDPSVAFSIQEFVGGSKRVFFAEGQQKKDWLEAFEDIVKKVDSDEPRIEGVLKKKSPSSGVWQTRVFCLHLEPHNERLVYYKSEQCQQNLQPSGTIYCSDISEVFVVPEPGDTLRTKFSIKMKAGRLYEMAADSDDQCLMWVDSLLDVVTPLPENEYWGDDSYTPMNTEKNAASQPVTRLRGQTQDMAEQKLVLEGFLKKKSHAWHQRWQQRYFVLQKQYDSLSYYKSQEDFKHNKPAGVIEGRDVRALNEKDADSLHFDLFITREGEESNIRTVELLAETPNQKAMWVKNIALWKGLMTSTSSATPSSPSLNQIKNETKGDISETVLPPPLPAPISSSPTSSSLETKTNDKSRNSLIRSHIIPKENITLSGYLEKLEYQEWVHRWTILHPGGLVFYESEDADIPLGKISILRGVSIGYQEIGEAQFAISMLGGSKKYLLKAQDSKERDRWLQAVAGHFHAVAATTQSNSHRRAEVKKYPSLPKALVLNKPPPPAPLEPPKQPGPPPPRQVQVVPPPPPSHDASTIGEVKSDGSKDIGHTGDIAGKYLAYVEEEATSGYGYKGYLTYQGILRKCELYPDGLAYYDGAGPDAKLEGQVAIGCDSLVRATGTSEFSVQSCVGGSANVFQAEDEEKCQRWIRYGTDAIQNRLIAEPAMQGLLKKKSPRGLIWQERLFCLIIEPFSHRLVYYKSSDDRELGKSAGSIYFNDVLNVFKVQEPGSDQPCRKFNIEMKSGRIFELAAPTTSNCRDWYEAIFPLVLSDDIALDTAKDDEESSIRAVSLTQVNQGWLGDVLIEGFLKKKSHANRHLWQQRYFVLRGGNLIYSKAKGGPAIRSLSVTADIKCAHLGREGSKGASGGLRFNLELFRDGGRLMELIAPTRELTEQWLDYLSGLVPVNNPRAFGADDSDSDWENEDSFLSDMMDNPAIAAALKAQREADSTASIRL